LGAAASGFDNVPLLLGEVAKARADRSGWSQTAEFASLILDSGWAWAATAVAVGWLVSRGTRPMVGTLRGALAGCAALVAATVAFYGGNLLVRGDFYWEAVWYWWLGSLLLGSPLGAVGATIRRPGPAGVLAALVVPVGAALNMVVRPLPAESPVAELVLLTVWGAVATATVLVVARAIRARRRGNRDSGAVVATEAPDDGVRGVVSGS
jgi:hypothetical protein